MTTEVCPPKIWCSLGPISKKMGQLCYPKIASPMQLAQRQRAKSRPSLDWIIG